MNALIISAWILSSSWAVENVTVHTGTGTVLENATVVVKNGKISAVGTNLHLGKKTKRIDGTGKILTPGFIESLSQIGLTEVSAV
jgi:imidazolonepropionase-like amidohydrolase